MRSLEPATRCPGRDFKDFASRVSSISNVVPLRAPNAPLLIVHASPERSSWAA